MAKKIPEEERQYYAYVYYDPERGVAMYAGKGYGNRAYDHLKSVKKNSRFRNRMKTLKKKGLIPIIEIFNMPDQDVAFACEIAMIAFYGRRDLGTGTLYNETDGGEGASGVVMSLETRKKISIKVTASYTPELRALRSAHFKSIPFTPERCAKMSAAKTGTVRSEASKKKQGQTLRGGNHYMAKFWTLQSPAGVVYETTDMTGFCAEHNLNYSALRNRSRERSLVPLMKGKGKGWVVISCVPKPKKQPQCTSSSPG